MCVISTPTSRLRRFRESAGWSLSEAADLAGLSAAMLSRVERGERQMAPQTKVTLARRFGVPVRELFDVDDLPESTEGK
jgi:transcriptional regulator with XRE-family HTH domain